MAFYSSFSEFLNFLMSSAATVVISGEPQAPTVENHLEYVSSEEYTRLPKVDQSFAAQPRIIGKGDSGPSAPIRLAKKNDDYLTTFKGSHTIPH